MSKKESRRTLTVREISDKIGRKRLRQELRVARSAVNNAVMYGSFPAKWFEVVERLTIELGETCDRSWFNFVTPKQQPSKAEAENAR